MWLIIGLIAGAAVLGLVLWMQARNISVKWYEWLIGALGLVLLPYPGSWLPAGSGLVKQRQPVELISTRVPLLRRERGDSFLSLQEGDSACKVFACK
jgi:hypothetical protein